jgi:hypothetical protein
MLIRIHQLRDKIYALARDLKQANADLEEEIRNCKHEWVDPKPSNLFDAYNSRIIERWIYTCEYCGERTYNFKGPKDK